MQQNRRRSTLLRLVFVVALVAASLLYASSAASAATPNPIQQENALPGTPGWDAFASVAQQDAISGFASKTSVNHGDSIDFYVTTTAASFKIDIFRVGWYQGIGARLMESLGTFPGVHQPIPLPDPTTGMVSCTNWSKTTTLNVPSTWVTGVYLAKLTASNGDDSFIVFTVRDDGGTEPILFQSSVTTYQAYNAYGGVSLYTNNTNGSSYKYPAATKVSFDRPYDPLDGNGTGHFFAYEYPFIRWAESQGYNISYITDVDTASGYPITNHRVYLSVGHDEYWSHSMRDNVTQAISQGVNAAFFSANTAYWQIRFEPNSLGAPNRVEVGYKESAIYNTPPGPDPQYGVNNSIVTSRWRDAPVNLPENSFIGVMYLDQTNTDRAYVVQNSSNWIYAGTGFSDGSTVPGIVGYEYDAVANNGFSPPGLTVLSKSPVTGCCEGTGNSYANSTLYTAPSGAQVFAGGTIQWSWGLDNYSSDGQYVNAGLQKTTANILNRFSAGAATPAPAVSLSPSNLSFTSQNVGTTSGSQTVTLTNSGTAALSLTGITVAGSSSADFAETSNCPTSPSTLATGASCTIAVTFSPTASGTRTANLSITDNAPDSPQSLGLSGTAVAPAPAVSLSPSSLSFGNQLVGTTGAAQTVTLTNSGTAALTISGLSFSGANSGDFAESTTCPTSPATLAVNASCTISVSFSPTASGSRVGSLSIADNAASSPQSVGITGTGVAPAPAVSMAPGSLSFTAVSLGSTSAAQSVKLTNSGTAALAISSIGIAGANANDFGQSSDCPMSPATLATGSSCTISVTFSPLGGGTWSASLSVADNAPGSPQTVGLSGTGNAPAVTLSQSSLTFANQIVGTTSTAQATTLTNSGTADLSITSLSLTGANTGDFIQSTNCPMSPSTVPANSSCSISVSFSPTASGSRSATLSIADNAADSTQRLALSGTAVDPAPAVSVSPTSLTFGSQAVGTSSGGLSATVKNVGTAPLAINGITVGGTNSGDFSEADNCPLAPATLAVNATCSVSVTFNPAATGARSATVAIADNAAGSPQSLALSGTGTAPAVTLSPASMSFGSQAVGKTSAAQTVTVKNSGTAPLSITGVTVGGTNSGDFAQTNNCPATLAVNATCTVSVTFTPAAAGARTGTLSVADNAVGSPQTVGFTGTGSTSAIAFDQALGKYTQNVGTASIALTTTAAATANSRVFVFVNWNDASGTLSSVTGGGLTWTVDVQAKDASYNHGAIASAYAPSGLKAGTSLTATFSKTVSDGLIAAASFTGLAATSAIDSTASNLQAGVAAWTGSVTTANANDLVLGWSGIDTNTTNTAAAPNTKIYGFGDSDLWEWSTAEYQIATTAGTKTVNGTWANASGASANVTVVAAYKGA